MTPFSRTAGLYHAHLPPVVLVSPLEDGLEGSEAKAELIAWHGRRVHGKELTVILHRDAKKGEILTLSKELGDLIDQAKAPYPSRH